MTPHAPITPEERAKLRAELPKRIEMIGKAREAIVEHVKRSGHLSGLICCPNCFGSLQYSQARSNGHIHAHCQTRLCVSWME